nr:MAG TPA: hypothetical protein [Caudoviricetes sp.]
MFCSFLSFSPPLFSVSKNCLHNNLLFSECQHIFLSY